MWAKYEVSTTYISLSHTFSAVESFLRFFDSPLKFCQVEKFCLTLVFTVYTADQWSYLAVDEMSLIQWMCTLLCLIVGGEGSYCKFREKTPQVDLDIIREWIENFPLYSILPIIKHKRVQDQVVARFIHCQVDINWRIRITLTSSFLYFLHFHQSLSENSMSVLDGQRLLWTAVEKFCNLLMLLNLDFYLTLGNSFIWTIKIIKYRLLILRLSAMFS